MVYIACILWHWLALSILHNNRGKGYIAAADWTKWNNSKCINMRLCVALLCLFFVWRWCDVLLLITLCADDFGWVYLLCAAHRVVCERGKLFTHKIKDCLKELVYTDVLYFWLFTKSRDEERRERKEKQTVHLVFYFVFVDELRTFVASYKLHFKWAGRVSDANKTNKFSSVITD